MLNATASTLLAPGAVALEPPVDREAPPELRASASLETRARPRRTTLEPTRSLPVDGLAPPGAREARALHVIGAAPRALPRRPSLQGRPPPYVPGRPYKLTLLHTNDTHGHFWRNKYGENGFAAQKTLVDRIRGEVRREGGHVLLLSAGDVNTGQPRSDLLDAEPDFRAMSLLGYDAMTLGNHEFDRPNAVLRRQQEMSTFPFLSANIYDAKTGARAFPAARTHDLDGLQVTVLGLTTEQTAVTANPQSIRAFRFRPAIEEAREQVAALRERSGLLIALSHLGYEREGVRPQATPGDAALSESVPGIDVVVGGHTHLELAEPRRHGDALVLQAGHAGRCLGRLDLEVLDGRIRSHRYALLPINKKAPRIAPDGQPLLGVDGAPILDPIGDPIPEDPEMLELLTPFYEASGQELERVVAKADTRFLRRGTDAEPESNLGRLVAAGMRAATGAEIGLMNLGGLRCDIEPGEVSFEELRTVMPFNNGLVTFELTGPELARYLEALDDQVVHASGVEITRRGGEVVGLRVGGEAVPVSGASTTRHRIVTSDFCGRGGDRWPSQVDNPTFKDTSIRDLDAFSQFVESKAVLRGLEFGVPTTRRLVAA